MRGEVIALDLETTGLDIATAEIIEVGIARCLGDEVLETYQTLVKPELEIPPKVTSITNISNEDVANAPSIAEVLPAIRAFIGDRPVIGHKIDFDLGMLNRYNIAKENIPVDTYELAAVLMPTADRYNLASLIEFYGLNLENAHRALDDAIAAWQVYRKLWARIFEIRPEVLAEILTNAAPLNWSATPALQDVYQLRLEELGKDALPPADFSSSFLPADVTQLFPALQPKAENELEEIDVHRLSAFLEPQGELAQAIPFYTHREGQTSFLQIVGMALNWERHLMFEAPLGIGASLGYLLPAAQWAYQNGERVVIAAANYDRVEQLLKEELPLIQQVVPIQAHPLMSRRHYLCPRRLAFIRRRQATSIEELRILAKILVWLSEGGSGERDDLNIRGAIERGLWNKFSAQADNCEASDCTLYNQGGCPLHKALHKLESAHILVGSHSLLIEDAQSEAPVIPPYHYAILDEAHQLEDAVTRHLAERVDQIGLMRRLSEIGSTQTGLLGDLLQQLADKLPEGRYTKIAAFVGNMAEVLQTSHQIMPRLFDLLTELVTAAALAEDEGLDLISTARVTPLMREHASWSRLLTLWEQAREYLVSISSSLEKLAVALEKNRDYYDGEDLDTHINELVTVATLLQKNHNHIQEWVAAPQAKRTYWLEIQLANHNVALHSAPLHVGDTLEATFWEKKRTMILVSEAWQTEKTFDFVDQRLNTDHNFDHATSPSPVNFAEQALVYQVSDIAEPAKRSEYQPVLEQGILALSKATEGRLMCVFTSHKHLRETASALTPALTELGFTVLDESLATNRKGFIQEFGEHEKAILFASGRHWEEGTTLPTSVPIMVLPKLPFEVPSDPIFAGRGETYGENSFLDYTLPTAILRLRMTFARLIQTPAEKGVFVIFDKRIISKRYGKQFMDSLPNPTIQRGTVGNLQRTAQQWLQKG